MSHRSKTQDTAPEAWRWQCRLCGDYGRYVGSYRAVAQRVHEGRNRFARITPCGGELRITSRVGEGR